MKSARCPTCKKDVAPDVKSFPFCAERCRLVDLGNWLDGRYRIASQNDERKPDPEEDPEKH
ncbi:MAG TPA: DNA gyrase inhibitor YacG [Polyangia bacterium]